MLDADEDEDERRRPLFVYGVIRPPQMTSSGIMDCKLSSARREQKMDCVDYFPIISLSPKDERRDKEPNRVRRQSQIKIRFSAHVSGKMCLFFHWN